jgi:hypothetical protein
MFRPLRAIFKWNTIISLEKAIDITTDYSVLLYQVVARNWPHSYSYTHLSQKISPTLFPYIQLAQQTSSALFSYTKLSQQISPNLLSSTKLSQQISPLYSLTLNCHNIPVPLCSLTPSCHNKSVPLYSLTLNCHNIPVPLCTNQPRSIVLHSTVTTYQSHCVQISPALLSYTQLSQHTSPNLNHWVMHPVARVSINIYRNLRMQQMSVLVLLWTSYTTCFGPYWWPSSGGL